MSGTMDDRQLLRRIANGEKTALEVLFARHHLRLFRFIERQVRNEQMAEELANDVFLDVWRQAGRFEGRSAVTTWLMSIARYKTLSALRKRRELPLDDDRMMLLEDGADNPEVTAQKTNKAEAMRSLIDQLSPEHKAVIDLAYYHEMPIQEIAGVLDIPPNTVKTRMFHARKKLAGLLEEAGIDRGWP